MNNEISRGFSRISTDRTQTKSLLHREEPTFCELRSEDLVPFVETVEIGGSFECAS